MEMKMKVESRPKTTPRVKKLVIESKEVGLGEWPKSRYRSTVGLFVY